MSLRAVHLVFIGASILLAVFVTFWAVAMIDSGRGGTEYVWLAGGALCAIVGMAVYAVKFVRKTREIGMR